MMARRWRYIALFVGAAVVVGAAIVAVRVTRHTDEQAVPLEVADKICLKRDLFLVKGAPGNCFAAGETATLTGRPVLDNQGAPVALELTHPNDSARAPETVTTCNAYETLAGDGWFALTNRDMRREAYFVRACGVLRLLQRAQPATISYFSGGACSLAGIESVAAAAPFALGEGDATAASVERISESQWRIAVDGQIADLQEIAHADFNGDGRGDMAVFISIGAIGGTARASRVGYLDKPGPEGPVRFIEP